MKMTVREAIDYIVRANGLPYTDELWRKIRDFINKLPRNPLEDDGRCYYIKDYNEGWYVKLYFGTTDGDKKFDICVVKADMMDESEERVKSNAEALAIMKEINEIPDPYEIDKYFEMSDDHKYVNRMYDMARRGYWEKRKLCQKL